MRRPTEPERLYLDFDGFFASVEQAARPRLRGRPVGVVPFEGAEQNGILIACSREAKLAGVGNIMRVREAIAVCPDILLVAQSPDLYRRAHNALISEISCVIPIDAVKSIDELTCIIAPEDRADPQALGRRIKTRLRDAIGPWITCSIGHAANRQLAKMACKAGKRVEPGRYGDGNMLWHPVEMPEPLLAVPLKDVPGVGERMAARLYQAGIIEMRDLLATAPKQMKALWGNVTGERLWYALHGYDIQTPPAGRGMYGHGRVLPPDGRSLDAARHNTRLLLIKAARRMRRDGYAAGRLSLDIALYGGGWHGSAWLPAVQDDQAPLEALVGLWARAMPDLPPRGQVARVHVTLSELTPAGERQMDLLLMDDARRQRWERVTAAIDTLNKRYGRTLVSIGPWVSSKGSNAGGKISFTRIPRAEDFW